MVVGFTECSRQYWQLQMTACLAVQNKKQAITRERELFSEIAKLMKALKCKTLGAEFDQLRIAL